MNLFTIPFTRRLGYPEKTIMETGFANIVRLIITLVASYLMPIAISCLTYVALICEKTRVGKNSIDIQNKTHEEKDISDLDNQLQISERSKSLNPPLEDSALNNSNHNQSQHDRNISIEDSQSDKTDQQHLESSGEIKSISNDQKSCDVTIDFSDEKFDLDSKAEERRQSEIRAAKRSIETNLLLCLIFVIVYGIFIFVSSRCFQLY